VTSGQRPVARNGLLIAGLAAALMARPARAEEPDLEAWWKDACLWEVGSNLEKVPAARKKLIEAGAPTLDFLIPAKLTAADTIITRALSMVITGIGGTATQEPQSPELRKKALDGLMTALSSADAVTRRNAADLLGQMGATEAAEKIAPLLKDPDARGGALAALGALKAEACVPDIAAMARDIDVSERGRFTAIATLGAIGGKLAQEALLEFLSDRTATVRFAAQYALEGLRSTGALVARLHDPNRRARLHVISALGRIGERSTRADLKPLLDDADPTVRGFVVEALGAMQKPSDAAWIRERLLTEKDEFVKGKLIEALQHVDSGGTE
jgi:HEAT repeat protein